MQVRKAAVLCAKLSPMAGSDIAPILDYIARSASMTHINEVSGRANKQNRAVFLGYIVSYIIIITVLFVTIGGYSYYSIVNASLDKARTELRNAISRHAEILDANVGVAIDASLSYYGNQEVARLRKLSYPFAPSAHINFQDLSRDLSLLAGNNNFIARSTLFFHNSQVFISSDMVGSRPHVYYGIRFPYSPKTYEQWKTDQISQEHGLFYMPDDPRNDELDLYYRLPFSDGSTGVTAITSLRIGNALENLSLLGTYQREAMIVTDSGGRVLYAGGSMATELQQLADGFDTDVVDYDGVQYMRFTQEMTLSRWSIHFLVDQRELYAEASSIRKSLYLVYFFVLIFSIMLAALFAKSTSDPVSSILRLIDGKNRGYAEPHEPLAKRRRWMNDHILYDIGEKVSDVFANNTELTRQVTDLNKSSRAIFFTKLLNGDAMRLEDIALFRDMEPEMFEFTCFTVIIADLKEACDDNPDGAAGSMALLLEKINAAGCQGLHPHQTKNNQAAVILCTDSELIRDDLLTRITELTAEVCSQTGARVLWGVGSTVYNIDQIFLSCRNALHALHSPDVPDDEICVWYDKSKSKLLKLRYSSEDELKLLSAMNLGDAELSKSIVYAIAQQNETVLGASEAHRRQFVSALSETFFRMENQLPDMDEANEKELRLYLWHMKNISDLDIIMPYCIMIINIFCDMVKSNNAGRCQKLLSGIYKYLDEHVEDQDICVASIAGHFGLTENYVSTFFKQNNGTSISHYIENARMLHAAALLKSTETSASVLAGQIGYSNVNTFYKAFKRYYGVSPKVFRSRESVME
jgi:AraC-like DNA-binding protein